MTELTSRRSFCRGSLAGAGLAVVASNTLAAEGPKIQGFEDTGSDTADDRVWTPVSDRRIKMGIVGFGVCQFWAAFSFQDHPNVEVVAVSDLFPDRCKNLARACRCSKAYPSLEEMLAKDREIEAVFLATDAPSHARHCIDVLNHGKHVCVAVPAVFGDLEDADRLLEAVKSSGLNYMMMETSAYREDCHAERVIFNAGGFGKMIYTEGEYYHYGEKSIGSYKNWRVGLPPQWYPTHGTAYYTAVTGGSFTEVSCMGIPSHLERLRHGDNAYNNVFGTEIALMRTSEGGMARMGRSSDTPGHNGEMGRARGQKGSMTGMSYEGKFDVSTLDLRRPVLPPGVKPGGHGGSHGPLSNEFVLSILEERKPLVHIGWSLNMTVAGVVAHTSALKDGESLKIPQYSF
jgi:predicted dehydrogenase